MWTGWRKLLPKFSQAEMPGFVPCKWGVAQRMSSGETDMYQLVFHLVESLMSTSFKKIALGAAFAVASVVAQAAPVVVDAFVNSSSGGTGAVAVSLLAGQGFTVTVGLTDLWNAGSLPRWSNADGLTGNAFATGSDESGQLAGTQISQDFGLYGQNGLSAAYGTLVGSFDNGSSFFKIGTSYSGTAASAGVLKLFYFDSNNGDNSGSITANVIAVPEPTSLALVLAGLGVVGFTAARRRG
jgi:hypothetical protein